MKIVIVFVLTLACSLALSERLKAQQDWTSMSAKAAKKLGDRAFDAKGYALALNAYSIVVEKGKKKKTDKGVALKLGLCNYHLKRMVQAIPFFEAHLKENLNASGEIWFYTAQAYHYTKEFNKAALCYKAAIKEFDKENTLRADAKLALLHCVSGKRLAGAKSNAIVTTLGEDVNTPEDEFRVVLKQGVNDYLFYSKKTTTVVPDGKAFTRSQSRAIWTSYLDQGNWTSSQALGARYNLGPNCMLWDFTPKGKQIIMGVGTSINTAEPVIDNYWDSYKEEEKKSNAIPFALNSSSNAVDKDYFMLNDSIVLFSSNRSGGYGGFDIYCAVKREGLWRAALNMGPEVNSVYDDCSPFLTANGCQVYYSSNEPQSIGGFDVYSNSFDPITSQWSTRNHLKQPINSSANDLGFLLTKDGDQAYFSSDRIGGYGGFDLYGVFFRAPIKEQQTIADSISFHIRRKVGLDLGLEAMTISDSLSMNKYGKDQGASSSSSIADKYELAPIYYDVSSGELIEGGATVNSLVKLLSTYKNTSVLLTVFSDDSKDALADYYLSLKQGEDLAELLSTNGVKASRIFIRGCGQQYPIAQNKTFTGNINELGRKLNRFIKIEVFNTNGLPMHIDYIEPKVSQVMRDGRYDYYSQRIEQLSYRIILTETPGLFKHPVLSTSKDIAAEKHYNAIKLTYTAGLFASFEAANNALVTFQEKGFTKATIRAYINGVPVNKTDKQLLLEQYTDLEEYFREE